MGLDCTHDCWHGPYSMFMRWRQWLNRFIMEERGNTGDESAIKISHMGATPEAIAKAWEDGHYDDQSVPINVLMAHSDCDGEIEAEACGPLAEALELLTNSWPTHRDGMDGVLPAGIYAARALLNRARQVEGRG